MDVIDAIGNTPLIELKKLCAGLPNRVFVKCEHMNPGGSVKDRTARAIILDAEARGVLVPHSNPPMTIIQRHGVRASGSRGIYEGDPIRDRLDRLQR